MKKILSLILLIVIAFSCFNFTINRVMAEDENLISNGSFELNKEGWSFNSGFYSVTENDSCSGNRAMQLKYTYSYYPTYVTVTQEIAVEKNKEYKLSYLYKQLSGGHIFTIYNADKTKMTETFYTSEKEDWTKNEYSFNSAENEKITIEIKDYSHIAPEIYFDDFLLKLNEIKLYVSPNGDDDNDGSVDSPLKSLDGARKRIRDLRNGNLKIPAEVIFQDGEYIISEGVEFTAEDSGTENNNVIYKADDGVKVQFKGAITLDTSKAEYVTDENIKNRMYQNVADKVLQFDLNEQEFPYQIEVYDAIRYSYPLYGQGTNKEYINIYLNETEQMISQWPNGDDNYATWIESIDAGDEQGGTKGGTFRYTETNPERWLNADSVWIGGHPGYDFRYERNSLGSIDTENKTITLATATEFGVDSEESRRWKAYNLLEEIDTPGEWYVDVNTMILYYYPPYDIANEKLEISFLEEDMISINNAKYITFEGIEFAESRCGAVKMTDVSDITVKNCVFKNLDGSAVEMEGTQKAETNNHWWQRQQIDAAYNCNIIDNIFYNIGGSAISINGGNVDTLTKANNIFENNFVFRYGTKARASVAVSVKGCGNIVRNNNISSGSFHAITYYGNDHVISNNEIYNVNKSTDDVGAIYTGRNYLHRGTEISYNYLHDLNPVEVLSRGFNVAIYFDDSACGQNVHHNIIVNSLIPIYTCGQSHTVSDNIMVNSNRGMYITNHYENEERMAMYQEQAATIAAPELYYEKYENLEKGFTDPWGKRNAFNEITGNLNVNAESVTIGTSAYLYGTVENNVSVDECSDFVNPEKQDYRIKLGSETATKQTGLLNESFDIDSIGLSTDIALNEETAGFDLIYPKNGEKFENTDEIEFAWENAFGANQYRLQIAEDAEFENIVYDEIVDYNIHTADVLYEYGKTYYWRVDAINISREMGNTWNSGEVFSFKTGTEFEIVSIEMENADAVSNIKAEMINNAYEEGKSAKVICAVYGAEGNLKNVVTEEQTFPYKENVLLNIPVKLLKGEKVSLMIWDENQRPLAQKVYSLNAGDYIKNGDFTQKGSEERQAADWTSTSWWQWQWKEGVGIDGTPGMHLTASTIGWQTLTQEIEVKKNTDYVLSYYYKQPDPGHTFQINGLTTGTSIISEQWMRSVLSDWTRVEYTFNSGENGNVRIVFKQMCDIGGEETKADVYIDNVRMYEAHTVWNKQ